MLTQNRRTDWEFSNTLTQNSLEQAQCHADPEPKSRPKVFKHVDPKLFRTGSVSCWPRTEEQTQSFQRRTTKVWIGSQRRLSPTDSSADGTVLSHSYMVQVNPSRWLRGFSLLRDTAKRATRELVWSVRTGAIDWQADGSIYPETLSLHLQYVVAV